MSNEKITADMIRELLAAMPSNIDDMMKMFGIGRLNYSIKQLEIVESMIEDKYPLGHKPLITTLIPFAYYLGECIIRSVPGSRWHVPDDASSLSDLTVSLKQGSASHLVYPFNRVSKFWKDRTDRMSTMVRMTAFMSEVQLSRNYMSKRVGKDGWIQSYYGDCYRMMLGDKNGKRMAGKSYMDAMKEMGKDEKEHE